MHYIWDVDRAESHIDKLCDSVEDVEIANYTRNMDLDNIPVNKAYEMDAVHIYVDILNLEDLLAKDGDENETSHKGLLDSSIHILEPSDIYWMSPSLYL